MASEGLQLIPDKRSELQKLTEYLKKGGDIDGLSDDWKLKWDRILAIDGIMRKNWSEKTQMKLLKKHELFSALSRTQIWRYRTACEEIIGTNHKPNKKYLRVIAGEMINKGFAMAKRLDDGRLWASMVKEYINLHALDVQDDDENRAPEPNANVLVLMMGDESMALDLNNPANIPIETRNQVVEVLYQSQTCVTPAFLDVKAEEVD